VHQKNGFEPPAHLLCHIIMSIQYCVEIDGRKNQNAKIKMQNYILKFKIKSI